MSGHTPGPWRCETWAGERHQVPVVIAADGETITSGVGGQTVGEAFANARLIAAAPDLLTACQSALSFFESGDGQDGTTEALCRAAIARATGGEP